MVANATAVPAAVRIAGMLAIGSAAMLEMLSLRRDHSPAPSSASANTPPRNTRTPGPRRPALNRRAPNENPAGRGRQAADPDYPARAEPFLEPGRGCGQ